MNGARKNIEDREHAIITWAKQHKKGILLVGGAILAIGTGYMVYENWDAIRAIFSPMKLKSTEIKNLQTSPKAAMPYVNVIPQVPEKVINRGEPFGVGEHIRNLSNGRNASAEKIAQALEHGFTLSEHQTWVDNYMKNCA